MVEQLPMWLRVFDVLVGIVLASLGIWVILGILNPAILIGVAVMRILGVILIIWGLWIFIKGFLAKEMATSYQPLLLIAAILLIVFGGLAFIHPLLLESLIALLFAIGLIIYGLIILITNFMGEEAKGWPRGVTIIFGFILVILGIIFVIYLQTAAQLLYFIIAIALIIAGFLRMIFGFSGEYY